MHAQGARDKWDTVLDRYETVCDQCLSLRSRIVAGEAVKDKEVASLLKEWDRLRQTLQDASGSMSESQRARFEVIRNRYAAALGTPKEETAAPEAATETPPRKRSAAETTSKSGRSSALQQEVSQPAPVPVSETERRIPGPAPVPPMNAPRVLSAPLSFSGRTQPEPFPRKNVSPATAGNREPASLDILAQVGLSRSRTSFGASLFYTPPRSHWGCFVSGRSNFTRTGSDYSCTSAGVLDGGGLFWGNGTDRYGIHALCAGAVFHPAKHLALYAGAGYGREELDWQDAALRWARVDDWSRSGLCAEAGVLLHLGPVSLSVGYSHVASPALVAGCGIHF